MKHSNKVDHRPSLQFYPDDWISDTALALCSLEAQGAWIRLLCHMHRSPERGVLLDAQSMPIDAQGLARLIATNDAQAMQILCELTTRGVASKRDDGAIYNRRMVRESCSENARTMHGRHAASMRWSMPKHGSSSPTPTPAPSPASKKGVATAASAAAEPRFTIPKPIVTVATAFGLNGYCGKLLKDGYEPQRLLAWLLVLARRKPEKPAAWLCGCVKGGKQPAEAYMAEALALLRSRDAEIAAENGQPVPSLAAVLPVAEVRGEPFAQKRNRVLNELKDAEGGGR